MGDSKGCDAESDRRLRDRRPFVAVAALAAFLTALGGSMTAFAATTVPEFDPNADVTLDMEGGSERPDEYLVMQAFEQQFSAFDRCVEAAKNGADVRLPGDVDVEVLLNPKGNRPLGVNAELSDQLEQQQPLRECLRRAVADAKYPGYQGPPIVVDFSFELDPGSVYVEE